MISLKRSYRWCRRRIDDLHSNAPPDEAFVLTVFFLEKIVRRTLLQLMIRTGLTKTDAIDAIKKLMGIWAVKKAWTKYDPMSRDLEAVLGTPNWEVIKDSANKRNDLVHGSGNEGQRVYKKAIRPLITTLDDIRDKFTSVYNYAGWQGMRDKAGNPL